MPKRVLLDLGDGETRSTTYEEFKRLVSTRPNLERKRLLLQHFPNEVAQEELEYAEVLRERRWMRYLSPAIHDPRLTPFFLDHNELVARALTIPPDSVTRSQYHRVTDFSSWFYKIKNLGEREHALRQGQIGERTIQQYKKFVALQSAASGWKMLHRDSLDGTTDPKQISLLEINGQPLRGSPDYVFENPTTKTILIIEIKVTDAALHIDGWPNLRAQLWAYSLIDDYVNRDSNIVLIGEVWSRVFNTSGGARMQLRQNLMWNATDPVFCKNNLELFEIYHDHVAKQHDA